MKNIHFYVTLLHIYFYTLLLVFDIPQGLAFSRVRVSKTILLMTTTSVVKKSVGLVINSRLTPETGCTDYSGVEPS